MRYTKSFIYFLAICLFGTLSSAMMLSKVDAFDASQGLRDKEKVQVTENNTEKDAKPTYSAADLKKGQKMYGSTCLFCHGAKGKGARAPSLIAGQWSPTGANDDAYMLKVIKEGRPGTIMGSFIDSFSEEEMLLIIAYLRSEAKFLAETKKKK